MSTTPEQEAKPAKGYSGCLKWCVALLVVCPILLALLIPAIQNAREAARRAGCMGNFKFSTLAMMNTESVDHQVSPAYLADAEGKPMHSWRTLILLYLGAEAFYEQFRLDEPWNSPHNIALADGVPCGMGGRIAVYHCLSEKGNLDTSQVVIVGKDTMFDGSRRRKIEDITDGTSCTIMIAEHSASGILWMEPRDLEFEKMSFKVNDPVGTGIRSVHAGSANVSFADGTVHPISDKIDPKVLKRLITINDGESITDSDLRR